MKLSTFTLIARDQESGEIAIAGCTNWFCYGRWVPHIEAGVGAVATQAETNMHYPELCFDSLRVGLTAEEVLKNLLLKEPDSEGIYQLLIMDNNGNSACHTGKENPIYAGFIAEKNFIVAGNTLFDEKTLRAVQDYYKNSTEELGVKVIKSLQAGRDAGGDIRGLRSAALKIAHPKNTGEYWEDIKYDIRVDESVDPMRELERLYRVACAYDFISMAEESGNLNKALSYYQQALGFEPDNTEAKFWMARIYASQGKKVLSDKLLDEICAINPRWREYWKRLDEKKF